jgi:hypothetical protein
VGEGETVKWLLRRIANTLLLLPFSLGWLVGYVVLCARYSWAALVEGYESGNRL